MYDITLIFKAIAEVAGIWKDERDPDKNKKRELLSLKKELNSRRKYLKTLGIILAKATALDDEKAVKSALVLQKNTLKEIKLLKKQIKEITN